MSRRYVPALSVLGGLLLALPVLPALLAGDVTVDTALVRLGAAIGLAWVAVTALAALLGGYAPAPAETDGPEEPGGADVAQPGRRAGDARTRGDG